jgi:protocatechuate 3,4-dioxygenase beta subunit
MADSGSTDRPGPGPGPGAVSGAVSRRQALAWFGTAGLAALAAACSSGPGAAGTALESTAAGTGTTTSTAVGGATATTTMTGTTATTALDANCLLTPEETEGPYYLAGEAVRTDITEGKVGMPLRLAFVVVNVDKCRGIANALVDIWHADATGNYSGFNATASNHTFLRGIQVTDANGAAGFHTVYPGWYQGRATHIHLKVHVGGNVVHTGQVFFDESVNSAVYATAAYTGRSGTRTLNSQDNIYAGGGAQSILHISQEGSGLVGAINLGVKV